MANLKLIKTYLWERRLYLLMGLPALLLADGVQLVIPRIIKWAIDDITYGSGEHLQNYCSYLLLAAITLGLFRFFWRFCIMGTARRVEEGLRQELFTHVQTLSASFFDKTTAGEIMAHATNDLKNIRMALGMGLVGLTDTLVLGTIAVVLMMNISSKLALAALLPMPLIAIFTKIFSRRLFLAYRHSQESFSRLMEFSRERFAGIRVIKTFNRQDIEYRAVETESQAYIQANMDLVKIRGVLFPLTILLTSISQAVVLGYGGRQVIIGSISPGDFVAFISYLALMTWPVMAIGWVINLMQRGGASLERLRVLLETVPSVRNEAAALSPPKFAGNFSLQNVFFSYGDNSAPVLRELDLEIISGSLIGIAGPPGSGKTTLVNLLTRLYDVDQGQISLDGVNLRKLECRALRQAIAVVPQEPFLFSGTLLENLKFGHPQAQSADIERVLEQAQLASTVATLPQGVETVIGEKGVMLSGGQKQRVALARAFLKKAPIMVLDDPISQVDMETAAALTAVIEQLATERTVIVTSHRFSVFRKAERIFVLKDGLLVAQGSHTELLKQNPYYAGAEAMQVVISG